MSADSVDVRMGKIETDVHSMDARLGKIETDVRTIETDLKIIKATMATKEEMHKELAAQTTRFAGWMFVVASMAVAAMKYLP